MPGSFARSLETLRKGRPHWLKPLLPFCPAGHPTAQAGCLCYPTPGFQTRPHPSDSTRNKCRISSSTSPGKTTVLATSSRNSS
jgi:hypothetical protein